METQNLQTPQMSATSNSTTPIEAYIDKSSLTAEEIQDWLVSHLAELLEIDPDEVDVTAPFDHYNLDSSAAVGLTGELEGWLECDVDPTLLYNYPTIEAQAQHLAKQVKLNR